MKSGEQNDILLYEAEDGKTRLDVQLDHETVWLNQRQMADLFDVKVPAISKHVRNIIASGELAANAILYRPDGSKRLADNALVALTLLIAESLPEEKETLVKVIVNLINRSNDSFAWDYGCAGSDQGAGVGP
jgi:hypothetical protein